MSNWFTPYLIIKFARPSFLIFFYSFKPGYFCPSQLDAIVCPPGHYCPGVGNRAPLECYPGTYNPFEKRSNCTVCPTGHICPGWGLLLPEVKLTLFFNIFH